MAYDKTLMSYDLKLRVPSRVAAHLSFALENYRIEVALVHSTPLPALCSEYNTLFNVAHILQEHTKFIANALCTMRNRQP